MAQGLCVTDFFISSGGRTDVRRHQESARHAMLTKSNGSNEAFVEPFSSSKGWMVQYVAYGQNEVDGVT